MREVCSWWPRAESNYLYKNFQFLSLMNIFVALIHGSSPQFLGKGVVWGILQTTIRRNQPSMRFASYDSNPPLRQRRKRKSYPRVAFFSSVGGEKQGACAPCAGDSKGRAYRPGPLRIYWPLPLRGSFARLRRAFVVLIRFRLSGLVLRPAHQSVYEWRT